MSKSSLKAVARSINTVRARHLISITLAGLTFLAPFNIARSQTANSKPQLLPNGKRYLEKGLKPATGRSGSASLTTRALLSKDGTTTVEMTTGGLDGGETRPGNINKTQLKPLDENGNALYARNYTGLQGGYFMTTVNDLHRGQQLQAQANINGVETGRTNVVTVVETVKLRPNLAAMDLSAPAKGAPGSPINISVVVREVNGDAGATANVILYADGVAVDRANNVWVDAGGTVSCVFTHKFTSAGTKQLEVKVEGATPGDYDVSNNAVTGSVQIGPLSSSELNYNVQVFDMDENYRSHVFERRYFNGILQSERDEDFSTQGWRQAANFYGWTARMIPFPINISHNETNDGVNVFSASYNNLTPTSVIDASDGITRFISYNVWRYDPVTGYYFNLYTNATINLETGGRVETTFFSSNRQAGDVTYYSSGYERFWDGYSGDEFFYSWNTTEVARAGARIPFGTLYGINVSLTPGDGAVYVASPMVSLSPFDNSGSQPSQCFDWAFDEYSGTSCVEYDAIRLGKHGYAYKDSNP
jgi:hypothetical protein